MWFPGQFLWPRGHVSEAEPGWGGQREGTAATRDTVPGSVPGLIFPGVPLRTGAVYKYQDPGSPYNISGCHLAPDTRTGGRMYTREYKRANGSTFYTKG